MGFAADQNADGGTNDEETHQGQTELSLHTQYSSVQAYSDQTNERIITVSLADARTPLADAIRKELCQLR